MTTATTSALAMCYHLFSTSAIHAPKAIPTATTTQTRHINVRSRVLSPRVATTISILSILMWRSHSQIQRIGYKNPCNILTALVFVPRLHLKSIRRATEDADMQIAQS
jgi:hypothetical protein